METTTLVCHFLSTVTNLHVTLKRHVIQGSPEEPKSSAPEDESHPSLLPYHWGASWLFLPRLWMIPHPSVQAVPLPKRSIIQVQLLLNIFLPLFHYVPSLGQDFSYPEIKAKAKPYFPYLNCGTVWNNFLYEGKTKRLRKTKGSELIASYTKRRSAFRTSQSSTSMLSCTGDIHRKIWNSTRI